MKGTSFQKPVEYGLRVEGESWNQGDTISGVLSVKNHGGESVPLDGLKLHLAHSLLRKVRAKTENAFESYASAEVASSPLAPQEQREIPWKFKLDRNTPITDHLSSLFFLYGSGESLDKLAQLQLAVQPDPVIQEFLERVKVRRFVLKSLKSGKDGVEAKFEPPTSQAFGALETLGLSFRFEEDTLEVGYKFQVKKVEATAASLDIKKLKKETFQSFRKDQYLLASGRMNQELMESSIQEALSLVEAKTLY